MKLWTLTNEYVEVIVNGELRKADLEYKGKRQMFSLDQKWYFVSEVI